MYTMHLNGKPVLFKIEKANSFVRRLKGWMFKQQIEPSDALWIFPCNSIHTFFMKFPIDVIFFDKNGKVVKLCENISPRSVRLAFYANAVIELHAGVIAEIEAKIGDQILLKGSLYETL